MADSLPVPGRLCLREEPLPEAAAETEEAELSLSLAFAKTRSYGIMASVAAALAEQHCLLQHRLGPFSSPCCQPCFSLIQIIKRLAKTGVGLGKK